MGRTALVVSTAVAVGMVSTGGFAATLTPGLSTHLISTIRIEPPRPGGLYGLARGAPEMREVDVGADKPVAAGKRRRR